MPRTASLRSWLCEGEGDRARQEVHKCWEGDDHDNKKSPIGADKEKEDDDVDTIMLSNHSAAIENPPPTITD